jgi:putative membrane protein
MIAAALHGVSANAFALLRSMRRHDTKRHRVARAWRRALPLNLCVPVVLVHAPLDCPTHDGSGTPSVQRRTSLCRGGARVRVLLSVFLLPVEAAAHGVAAANDGWAWNGQAWLWLLLVLSAVLVARGTLSLWRHAAPGAGIRRWQAASFAAGWLALSGAILSPLDALGQQLFWVHMVQHETLMLIAAPLLVLARPLAALVWGLPARWRPVAGRLVAKSGLKLPARVFTRPLAAWWLHAVVLWSWHAPALFEAALREQGVHELQHLSFFVSALLFWSALFDGARVRFGSAVIYLFTTAVHTAVLGALLTLSGRVLYPSYAQSAPHWGLTALEDQQLGGLIMWVPGGMIFLVAALALFAAWLGAGERAARRRPMPVQ